MNFKISNRNISRTCKDCIIGDNNNYNAQFEFDDEWTGKLKTARFCHGSTYIDVILDDDNACLIPSEKSGWLQIGVYTADMTTTSCSVYVLESVKDSGTPQPAPAEDIYQQLLKKIEQGASTEAIDAAVQDYMDKHPVDLKGYATEEYVKQYVDEAVKDIDLSNYVKTSDLNKSISDYVNEHKEELKGSKGDKGDAFTYADFTEEQLEALKGKAGYTPIKGTDYWTLADKADIVNETKEAIGSTGYDDTEVRGLIAANTAAIAKKPNASDIPTVPTNVSAFNNDSGYLTEHQDISGLATKLEVNAAINNVYSKTDIDAMIGDVEALLGGI